MPEETCYELDCCPLGTSIPSFQTSLSLLGEDASGVDPNIANNDPLLLQEAYETEASTTGGSPTITVAPYSGNPIYQTQTVSVTGIYKTINTVVNSPSFSVSDASGLTTGLNVFDTFFPVTATISSIVGLTVTMDQNPIHGELNSDALFQGPAGSVPANIIPSGTTVSSVSGTTVTLSSNATTGVTRLLLRFSPADVDPNTVDGYEIFT